MFSSRLALAAIASALFTSATAQLKILAPGGDSLWWVDQSENTLVWNCNDSGNITEFSVLLQNPNVNLLPSPLPIIGILENYVCSKTISQDLFSLNAGTGYIVQLTDILNNTHIYAESQPFELKAFGSSYPDASATPSASGGSTPSSSGSGSPSGTSSGSNPSGTTKSNTSGSMKAVLSNVAAFVAVAAGVVMA